MALRTAGMPGMYDHRTEGRIHITKKTEISLGEKRMIIRPTGIRKETEHLKGPFMAFAAEDIVHPDAEVTGNGILTNTGVVYKKNGILWQRQQQRSGWKCGIFCVIRKHRGWSTIIRPERSEKDGYLLNGPGNLYQEEHGEERKLVDRETADSGKILYKRTPSRSGGIRASVNGMDQEITNRGAGFETPGSVTDANGTAVVTMPEPHSGNGGR